MMHAAHDERAEPADAVADDLIADGVGDEGEQSAPPGCTGEFGPAAMGTARLRVVRP